MINANNYDVLFRENYSKLTDQSRIIWWKGNQMGYNDNIYSSDDILHDLFFSFKKSIDNESLTYFNDLDHFFAMTYNRMKYIYIGYLKKKWNRSKRDKMFFKELGYTYETNDILNSLFDYNIDEYDVNSFTSDDILRCIRDIENEEQKRILLLKKQDASHENICKHFNISRQELRNKLYNSRKKLFKKLTEKGIINKDVLFKEFTGETTKKGKILRIVRDKKYLYNNYPFYDSYCDKIKFVISKNRGKVHLDLLPEIIKYNEGHEIRKDNRASVSYAIDKCLKDYSCFIIDGIIYLK